MPIEYRTYIRIAEYTLETLRKVNIASQNGCKN